MKKVLCCNRQDWTEGEDRSRIAGFPVQTAAALDLSFLLSNVKNRDLSTDNTPKMDEIRLMTCSELLIIHISIYIYIAVKTIKRVKRACIGKVITYDYRRDESKKD